MTDIPEIQPALTAEEWADKYAYGLPLHQVDECVGDTPDERAYIVALNNAALPDDDPRKITRADVESVNQAADFMYDEEEARSREPSKHTLSSALEALAAKLAALLPPVE